MTKALEISKLCKTYENGFQALKSVSITVEQGDFFALLGPNGAGKTTLSRGLIQALLGADTEVPSPTYTLVQTYEAPDFDIWHFDLYRLEREADVWELGIEDAIENGLCLIEWPQRIESLLPDTALTIQIETKDDGRLAVLAGGDNWEARLENL